MSTQITIIGLGQIGASVGLALGKFDKDFLRIGIDTEPSQAKQAKNLSNSLFSRCFARFFGQRLFASLRIILP